MKVILVFCFLALAAVAFARPEEEYTSKYDNINVQEILDNKRLLEAHVKCLIEKGKCTPEGLELKSHMKEALQNKCGKCTEKQKEGTKTVMTHLINKEPEYWSQLTAFFDPDNKYATLYEKEYKELKE